MDIRIKGGMSGIETAEVIRSRFGIPIIFSTADQDDERIDRAKTNIPFGYVLKPIHETVIIIIIEIDLDGESVMIGALVDSVKEVMDLDSDQIEPPPRIGTNLNIDFIKGMGKQDGQFVIILDIGKIFSFEELEILQQVSE